MNEKGDDIFPTQVILTSKRQRAKFSKLVASPTRSLNSLVMIREQIETLKRWH